MAIGRKRPKKVTTEDDDVGSAPQLLPDDLVLEIVARCPTLADVVRCAATSKPIRRGILNAAFIRSFFLLRDARDEHDIPSVLLGVYLKSHDDPDRPMAFVPAADFATKKYPPSVATLPTTTAPPNRDADAAGECRYGSYQPVASRRSLLVLRRWCSVRGQGHLTARHGGLHPVELSVCNPTTGQRWVLPAQALVDASHTLLDVQPLLLEPSSPGFKFKLLVAELTESDPKTLYVQIFSSEENVWGPVLCCRISRSCEFVPAGRGGGRPAPVVLGDTVNWLCTTTVSHRVLSWRWRGNGGREVHETSLIKLPPWLVPSDVETCLAALPAEGDHEAAGPRLLTLVVQERGEVQLWVREKSGRRYRFTWQLRGRIQGTDVAPRPTMGPGPPGDAWFRDKELRGFSEGSGGTLFFLGFGNRSNPSLHGVECNGAASRQLRATRFGYMHPLATFCPYEIDLISYMLLGMKIF